MYDRRFLTGITEYDGDDNLSKPGYAFDYFSYADAPEINSFAQDFWGYYNGAGNTEFCPTVKYSPDFGPNICYGANRLPNASYIQTGTLSKITYPTGGYTNFTYEPHTFADPYYTPEENPITTGGGIRISQITGFDGSATTKSTYSYTGGKLITRPTFTSGSVAQGTMYSAGYLTIQAKNMASLGTSQGSFVIYNNVVETKGDGSGNIGKSIQYFPNIAMTQSDSYFPFPYKYPSIEYKLNKCDSVEVYAAGASSPKEIKTYEYENVNPQPLGCVKLGMALSSYSNFFPTANNNYVIKGYYELNSYWSRTKSETTKTIGDDNKKITQTTDYSYLDDVGNTHHQLKSKTETQSNGTSQSVSYKYPSEYNTCSVNYGDDMNKAISDFKDKNIKNIPIETVVRKGTNITDANITLFKKFPNSSINYLPYQVLKYEQTLPYTNFIESTVNTCLFNKDSNYKTTLLQIDGYDTKENILQFEKNDYVSTSVIYGYNQAYPVIKAQNITNSALTGAVTSYFNSVGSDLSTLLNNVGDLSTATQRSQWTTFNTGLRQLSALAGIPVYTYTFKPLVGVTSETDPSGRTVYYEYDGFGRLTLTRDRDGNILQRYDYHYKSEGK
jgi:YD repeat-containing protein